jgi:hypothetical protein
LKRLLLPLIRTMIAAAAVLRPLDRAWHVDSHASTTPRRANASRRRAVLHLRKVVRLS